GTTGSAGANGTGGTAGGGGLTCVHAKGCCAKDADCAATEECVGAVCTLNVKTSGVCKTLPTTRTGCWKNADCPALTPTCAGASVCGCGQQCLLADKMGTCQKLVATTN
ncbi:MAG: hypothetical protein JWM82_837, partial [Myxococcales bacterium]|nr:hypothetical protein [Myxococcales bacterium]